MYVRNYKNPDRPFRYTDEEKLGMIKEYLTTDISQDAMSEKYGIGHSSIPRWMRILGIPMPDGVSVQNSMAQKKTVREEPISSEAIEVRFRELKAELEREKLKNLALTTMIEVAEEELHINIRKKAGAKQ